jgi:hypothetical protein
MALLLLTQGELGDPPQDICPVAPGTSPSYQPSSVDLTPSDQPSSKPSLSPSGPSVSSDVPTTLSPSVIPSDFPSYSPSGGLPTTSSPTSSSDAPTKGGLTPTCPPIGGSKPSPNGDNFFSTKSPGNGMPTSNDEQRKPNRKKNKSDNQHVEFKGKRHFRQLKVGRRPSPAPTQCPEEELAPPISKDPKELPKKKNRRKEPNHGELKKKGDNENDTPKNIKKKKSKEKDRKDPSKIDRDDDAEADSLK